jgi:hypothetical protein
MVDSREDRHRVLNELSRGVQEPTTTLVVCSLTTTPDRGVATFLAEVAARLTRPPALALSGGERLRQRAEHARLEVRVADWRAIAARAGIPDNRVVEIDFDHLTHNSLARLGAMIEAGSNGHVPTPALHERRLEDAFAAVVDYASRSEASGGAMSEDHTALHRAIARIYGNDGTDWQRLFRLPTSLASLKPADFPAALRSSAERFTLLLPARLRASPKWLAAGATTGALGCVAASALLSPVAISALPVWSLIGAAVAAAAQPPGKGDLSRTANTGAPSPNDQIVRSAALFAMLLEMQGRDEAIISRVLDRAIPDDLAEPSIPSAAQVRHWLDDLRHRFDVALEQETAA